MSRTAIDRFLEQEPPRTINTEIWARQLGFGGLLLHAFCALVAAAGMMMVGWVALGGEVRNSETGGDGSSIPLALGCIAVTLGVGVGTYFFRRRRAAVAVLRHGQPAEARVVEVQKTADHVDGPSHVRVTLLVTVDGRAIRRSITVHASVAAAAERQEVAGTSTRVLISADRKSVVWIDRPIS